MVYAERTTWSATDLATLSEDGYRYELVNTFHQPIDPSTIDLLQYEYAEHRVVHPLLAQAQQQEEGQGREN